MLLVVLLYDARLAAGSRLEQYRSVSAPIFVLKRRCCRSALQNKLMLVDTAGKIQSLAPNTLTGTAACRCPALGRCQHPKGTAGREGKEGSLETFAFSWGRSCLAAAGLRDAVLCLKGAPGSCSFQPGKRSAERRSATSPHHCRGASAASLAQGEAVRCPGGVTQLSASLNAWEMEEMPLLQHGEQS